EYKVVNEAAVYQYEEANALWEEVKKNFDQNRADLKTDSKRSVRPNAHRVEAFVGLSVKVSFAETADIRDVQI
uniref:SMC hinge domain-containing protein n=1 Tax=Parascaris univalens TaxID=6257 RepID=A0A914ZZV7_PARUN